MKLDIPYIGLSGVAGAGKDTVFDRLVALGGERFQRLSVADPLKESVSELFGISLERLDELKRDSGCVVTIGEYLQNPEWQSETIFRSDPAVELTMREFLQRYGTEAHRKVFGDDFWLDEWAHRAKRIHIRRKPCTVVNTSVRFVNEAEKIIELGGQVWHVDGPQDEGAGGHESELELPAHLITHRIDNTVRKLDWGTAGYGMPDRSAPNFNHLDDQLATLLHGGTA